jgi:hypothetical protein
MQRLRVWYNLRVPRTTFTTEVANLVEARLLLDTLARYDEFCFNNKLAKYGYNAGGLQVWSDVEQTWMHWIDEETFSEIDDYTLEQLRQANDDIRTTS